MTNLGLFALDELPLWVEFEKAKELFHNGEFQDALDFFIKATKADTPYPEAEYMIGLLYLEEGELKIAEEQVKRAIELSPYLQSQEDLTHYKYTLADIFLLKEDYNNYIETLKGIIGGDEIDLSDVRDQKAYFDVLINSGMNRLLHLYRKKADNVINARLLLGYYYHGIQDYKNSVNYLLSPCLALISEVIDDNIQMDREYTFTDINSFLKDSKNNRRINTYYEEHDFYKVLYYLGESLLGLGYKDRALEIWSILAESDIDSLWVKKSKKQILNPTLENWKVIY